MVGSSERSGWADILVAGVLPGALLGAQIAGLVFFLNPELPFAPGTVLRGMGLFAVWLGLGSLLIHLPFLWNRPQRAWRALPWGLTTALAVAAVLDWTHASVYTYFLPPGINARLIKAASWLTVATLVAFYTALLHSLQRRPYGRRSRIGFALLVLFSLFIMVERREAFQPPPAVSPLPSSAESGERRRVLVVGVEGATLEALLPLAEQGYLPFFSRILREGAYGRLESLSPNRRLALWTSLASGKYPYRHRVLGEQSYRAELLAPGAHFQLLPRGMGFRHWGLTVLGAETRDREGGGEVSRLWEIFPSMGIPAGVVGWPGGSEASVGGEGPGARPPVFVVGDRFFDNPLESEAVRPVETAARGRLFRVRGDEVDPALLLPFGADPPRVVVESLAEDVWRESLFRFLLDQYDEVDAGFLHLPGLGAVSRAFFGGYAKAQFEGAQHRDYLHAAEVLDRYYAQVDGMLARLWEVGGPQGSPQRDTLLVVVSAFGTAEPRGWRGVVTELAGGRPLEGYTEGSPDGVLLLFGSGVAAGSLLSGAELVDVVPTVMYGLGLPIARDLDGQILTEAFERGFLARHPLTFVPSYETLR